MPRPFVAYLRAYEPLEAFDSPLREQLNRSLRMGALAQADAADREREMWLRSQLSTPVRMLPRDRDTAPMDVLVIEPDQLGDADREMAGPGPWVCPLDLRQRSAAGLATFLADAPSALRAATLPMAEDTMRARVAGALSELPPAAHIVTATWTVPLPWFALFDPTTRQLDPAPGEDTGRRVSWRSALVTVRHRGERAFQVLNDSLGPEGPAGLIRAALEWIDHFHPDSVIELDYGGITQLLDDADLAADSSAEDVHAALAALSDGDAERVAVHYERLREFWGTLAAREHHN